MTDKRVIINGPGRWDMAIATYDPDKTVRFTLAGIKVDNDGVVTHSRHNPQEIIAAITGVEVDQGVCYLGDERRIFIIRGYSDDPGLNKGTGTRVEFQAHYDLKKRIGELDIMSRF